MSIVEQAGDGPGHQQSSASIRDTEASTDGRDGGDQHFTGVVLIHGLGLIPRNRMLQQALNALSYWFNYKAGLHLSTRGPGRFWLTPHLTDDPDPDQPASRAIMDVVAPSPTNGADSQDGAVRLEFREVWWADSFGIPDIGQTISWAQVQWREQATRLLIPVRWRRRSTNFSSAPADAKSTSASSADRVQLSRGTRNTLRSLLLLYDVYQYLWKVVQWLILTPVIALLLIVMGIVRLLAVIPFLQSAIITTFTAIINTVMLHWVAEIQVYLTDYTRSSAIRERFSKEVEDLLRNCLCDRVVVIAESGGTYIAYEGLTTLLEKPDLPRTKDGTPKPLTFVSIATALRRIWLLSNTDVHRLHGILPSYVRWLHFWARYDPVAAGPLNGSSLPRIPKWDPPEANPYQDIRASLKTCRNFDVVNSDSTFTDHTGYWDNLEQVVGQVACELVADHSALEQAVQSSLASADEVLLRRWGVAWRYALASVGGLAAGIAVVAWAVSHPEFRNSITDLLKQVDWDGLVTSVCQPCKAFIGKSAPDLGKSPSVHQLEQYSRAQAITYLFTHYLTVPNILVATLALVVLGLVNALITQLTAKETPFAFAEAEESTGQRLGGLYTVGAIGVVLVFLASLIFTGYVHTPVLYAGLVPKDQLVTAYTWALGLGEAAYSVAFIATAVDIIQRRLWGWGIGLLLALTALTTFNPFYRGAVLAVVVVGCVVLLFRPIQTGGLAGKVSLALVALMAIDAGIGTTLYDFNVVHTPLLGAGVYVEYLLPLLIYALWSGKAQPAGVQSQMSALRRTIAILAVVDFGLVDVLSIPYIGVYVHPTLIAPSLDIVGASSASSPDGLRAAGVLCALVLGVMMLVLAVVDTINEKRLGWLVGLLLIFAGMMAWFEGFYLLRVQSTLPEGGTLLAFALAVPALCYVFWVGSRRWRARRKARSPDPATAST